MDRTAFPDRVTVIDLIVILLAAKAMVDLWRDSSLMSTWRARLEARGGLLAELSECRFCLSHHAVFFCSFVLRWFSSCPPEWISPVFPQIVFVLLNALAAIGAFTLLDDLTQKREITPAVNHMIEEDDDQIPAENETDS